MEGLAAARRTGFPTANIPFAAPDISGTYAGKVTVGALEYKAAIYANAKRQVLEAHLLNFSGDLYGKTVTMTLLEKMAEAKTFQGVQDEKSFIDWAVAEVEKYFNQTE